MVSARSHWLNRAAILVLLVTAVLIALIAAGVFDPQPLGALRWQTAEQRVTAPAKSREIRWVEEGVPQSSTTLRLTAALADGETDSGYGLVLGDEENYLTVAVSPLGYLAIWESSLNPGAAGDTYLLQWQTWPHVKMNGEANELWLDVEGNQATVRVNREWLWEGPINNTGPQVGLLVESYGDAAVVDFMELALFADEDR